MQATRVFKKNITAFNTGVRRIVNQGGTSSSKTFSILQLLLLIAQKRQGVIISVMSETLPHLKLGAIRDFEKILKAENLYEEGKINRTDRVYTFGKSIVEFFSADTPGKVTGSRRNILFVNEANNIPYSIVEEAEIRTENNIFYDYNPTADFWITKEIFTLPSSEFTLIKSNYKDNNNLPASVAREIELKATRDENFNRVHILNEFGITEGLIFGAGFTLVDDLPETPRALLGLDFGFTNDPTALIDVRINDGKLWLDELLYQTQLTNEAIARFIIGAGLAGRRIIADAAEAKSITTLQLAGLKVEAATKGQGSVNAGIDKIKAFPLMVTKRSVNLIKELRTYRWKTDRSGATLNVPVDLNNHALDATRYALEDLFAGQIAPAKITWRR